MVNKFALVIFATVLAAASAATIFATLPTVDCGIVSFGGDYSTTNFYYIYRNTRYPLIKFEFPNLPSDAYILSAKLNLTFFDYGTDWG
jgi:hypothetical protein